MSIWPQGKLYEQLSTDSGWHEPVKHSIQLPDKRELEFTAQPLIDESETPEEPDNRVKYFIQQTWKTKGYEFPPEFINWADHREIEALFFLVMITSVDLAGLAVGKDPIGRFYSEYYSEEDYKNYIDEMSLLLSILFSPKWETYG